jgi:hypothetical protein
VRALLLAASLSLVLAAPVVAQQEDRCELTITALDAAGAEIDTALVEGRDAPPEAALEVPWDGRLAYVGRIEEPLPAEYRYETRAFGVPLPVRDTVSGEDVTAEDAGTVELDIGVPYVGLYHVTGRLDGDGISCERAFWIRVTGDPAQTPQLWIALLVLLAGLAAAAGPPLRGGWSRGAMIGGSLLVALALAVLVITFGLMPFGPVTPPVLAVLIVALGVIVALIGSQFRRRPPPEPLPA